MTIYKTSRDSEEAWEEVTKDSMAKDFSRELLRMFLLLEFKKILEHFVWESTLTWVNLQIIAEITKKNL